MPSAYQDLAEIQGVSFGDQPPIPESVLATLHVRIPGGKEGARDALLFHADVLRGLIAGLPEVMDALRAEGVDGDRLPPPGIPVPAWNDGPKWNPTTANFQLCMGFGVREIAPELGAAVVIMQTASLAHPSGQSDSGDYLMGWNALNAFQEALPKVLRRLERKGVK
jgi:hypothetical protein